MEFRTPVHIAPFGFRIGHSHKGLLIGSCFADRIGRIMRNHKLPVTVNPFGTLFNPASIAATLKRLEERRSYDAGDLTRYEERWISFDHHGAFDGSDCEQTLRRINEALETGAEALRTADYAILTLGTAWVYELRDTGRIVANCHKLPAAMFRRRRMSASEIVETLGEAITRFLPGRKTILTVSPIRHLGDGATENTLSKSTLILAAHALTESLPECRYFPAYEILMDDLRDYRFYANILYDGSTYNGHVMDIHYTREGNNEIPGEDLTAYGTSTTAAVTRTGYYMGKFVNEKQQINNDEAYASSQNYIIWRYAEVLLDYAEVMFRLGNTEAERTQVNAIRRRAHMDELPSLTWGQLVNERRVELAFEETSYWDIFRWGIAEEKLNGSSNPIKAMKIVHQMNGDITHTVSNMDRFPTRVRVFQKMQYYLPIPWDEIRYHEIEQNPEWVEV